MTGMAQAPSDTDTSRPISDGSRSYELVDDAGIEVTTQFKLVSYSVLKSAYSSAGLGRKKVHDGGRCCGEGSVRGKAGREQNEKRVVVAEKQKERRWKTENGEGERGGKARRCGGQFICMLLPLLPGFRIGKGKGKGKEERKGEEEEEEEEEEEGSGCISISISRRVSLEKFECGSWASSGMVVHEEGESGTASLYFDLPMELIRNSVGAQTQTQTQSQSHSPVKAADRNGSGGASLTLSPSPPSRLRIPIQEFNALLEAHALTL